MRKISGSVFHFKVLFPIIWFGFLGVCLLIGLFADDASPLLVIASVAMGIFGFVLLKMLIWDLADEVHDSGDSLVFRKGGTEQRVRLDEIVNINYVYGTSPERITVLVRTSGAIGKELVFAPPLRGNPFSRAPIVAELIERVDAARRARK